MNGPDMERVCNLAERLESELCGGYKEVKELFACELAYLIEDYATKVTELDVLVHGADDE